MEEQRQRNRNKKWREDMCPHRRKKYNWPFGRKSKPIVRCKDCGYTVVRRKLEYELLAAKKNNRR